MTKKLKKKLDEKKNKHPDQILIDLIFQAIPSAEIYGIYVAHHVLKQTELCPEINILISKEDSPLILLLLFLLDNNQYLSERKTRAFCNKFESQIKTKINGKDILVTISVGELLNQVHFICNCLKMNRNFETKLLLEPPDESPIMFRDRIHEHILKRKLVMTGSFGQIKTLYEIRVSYSKLVRDAVCLINQGWRLKDNLKFRIYSETKDQICAICHNSVLEGFSMNLKCNHIFHLNCIHESLMEPGPSGSRCPVCREEIISYDYIKKEIIW